MGRPERYFPGFDQENVCPFLPPVSFRDEGAARPSDCLSYSCVFWSEASRECSVRVLADRLTDPDVVDGKPLAALRSLIQGQSAVQGGVEGLRKAVAEAGGAISEGVGGKLGAVETQVAQVLAAIRSADHGVRDVGQELGEGFGAAFRDLAERMKGLAEHLARQGGGSVEAILREREGRMRAASWSAVRALHDGSLDRAEADLLAARSEADPSAPHQPSLLGNLGVVLERKGETPRALEVFRDAINRDDGALAPRVNLAVVHLRQGRTGRARERLEEAGRLAEDGSARSPVLHPGETSVLFANLALAHYQEGQVQRAAACWREALRHDPWNLEAREALDLLRCPADGAAPDPLDAVDAAVTSRPEEA